MGNNIVRKDKMNNTDKWKRKDPRIVYLNTFIKPLPNTCPECEGDLESGEAESYCTRCGLVVTASIEYVAGEHIILPYGRH